MLQTLPSRRTESAGSAPPRTGAYKVDISRGERIGRVSSERFMGLSVRAVVDEAGAETGMFEIPAGGRRYRALALLVKQRRLAKTAPVPCVVREGGLAEEDSLAEKVQRAPLHPLDQFRAFLALRAKGQSVEEIAANQFVSVAVVKQRLRLTVRPGFPVRVIVNKDLVLRPYGAITASRMGPGTP